jgi:hypothetical protein
VSHDACGCTAAAWHAHPLVSLRACNLEPAADMTCESWLNTAGTAHLTRATRLCSRTAYEDEFKTPPVCPVHRHVIQAAPRPHIPFDATTSSRSDYKEVRRYLWRAGVVGIHATLASLRALSRTGQLAQADMSGLCVPTCVPSGRASAPVMLIGTPLMAVPVVVSAE